MTTSKAGALLATAIALLVGGCGDSSPIEPVTASERPERIVSLSPSATEALFAVGAGDQVIAVDDESDYPAAAPSTDLSAYQPNVEAIVRYRPDLVVVPATVPRDVIGGLRDLGLSVLVEPAPRQLRGAYRQIRLLGAATGHRAAGERVAREVRARVERAIAAAPDGSSPKVFHELDPDLFSAGSETFIGRIYARLGLRNIADPAAESAGTPYPQLSSEGVVAADPDLIVLADSECCGQTPAKVLDRPGWQTVSAVRSGAVVAIDDDIASRWGPRIPLFVEAVARAMRLAEDGGGSAR